MGQACCAGSSAITPARLATHEDGAAGAILRGTVVLGGWDGQGNYFVQPPGTAEFDAELDVVGTLRVFSDGQVSLLVPFVKTWRDARGISEWGGGLGDINLGGRYDFTHAGEFTTWPGIALLLGITFPSGRAPEAASNLLATDATGIGAFQFTGGIALEQSFGHFLVNLTALAAWRTPRSVRGVHETLGVQLQGLAGVGYAFDNDASIALSLGYVGELDAAINGQKVPDSGRALPTVGLSGSLPVGESWRLQGGVNYNPPISGLGKNQTAGIGFTFSFLRTWI
jgi:hypothetical protein